MTDIWDSKKRSDVMSKIRSKNTKPEILLRKALFSKGYRYRVNDKNLPGKPDIVFRKYKTAIFVNGCFWHYHKECKEGRIPSTNTKFWKEKLSKNVERDNLNINKLEALGWVVMVIWECEIEKQIDITMKKIINNLKLINLQE